MKLNVNLEFRKLEENNYDFVDNSGKRVSGVSKVYTFMNEDEELLRVGLPKDVVIDAEMKKGQSYDVVLDCKLKPMVDKNGNVNNKQFFAYFQLLEVLANPFTPEVKKEDKK